MEYIGGQVSSNKYKKRCYSKWGCDCYCKPYFANSEGDVTASFQTDPEHNRSSRLDEQHPNKVSAGDEMSVLVR